MRILASCVVLLALSGALSTLVVHELLSSRLTVRTEDALEQEVLELNRLLADGRDPRTGERFASLQAAFDVYFARNVPSNEEGMLAFVDGKVYRSSLRRFPQQRLPDGVLPRLESAIRSPASAGAGRFETEFGDLYYRTLPVQLGDGTGAFVVVMLPLAEQGQIGALRSYGTLTILGVVLLTSVCAWFIAGRVLRPVRLLTETAQWISESDLTRRIKASGTDEAAEMARTFNAMLDRLELVFRSQREFIHDASHELGVPLTVCLGHLGLLDDNADERDRIIALVTDELERMARIVSDLRLLAEVEQPGFLQLEDIELGPFTHELLAKASALAPRRWAVDSAAGGALVADRYRLTEAVMNLAHNAVQHTIADHTVTIGTSHSSSEARIWVRDTGRGIPASDHARIFERLDRGTNGDPGSRGAGLGLATVRAIAEAHGGRVALESELGAGSTFTIIIPRRQAAVNDDTDPDR